MGFVGFDSIMPIIYVLHVCFSFLCIIPCLCCVVHIMFMIKCLIDVSCVSVDSMEYNGCRDDYVSLILKCYMIMWFSTLP